MEDDLRDNPFVRLLLGTLLEKEPQTATEIQHNLGLSIEWAKRLREKAEAGGLIRQEEAFEGRVRFRLVHLTPEGRVAALRRAEYDSALQRAMDSAQRRPRKTD